MMIITLAALLFPGPDPGVAQAHLEKTSLTLENATLRVTWNLESPRFELSSITDRLGNKTVWPESSELFVLKLADGNELPASKLSVVAKPLLQKLSAKPGAVRAADACAGWKSALEFKSPDGRISVQWRASLRDQSNYVRQEVSITAVGAELPLREVTLLNLRAPGAKSVGLTDGSPVVADNVFFGCEHPMFKSRLDNEKTICAVPRHSPLRAGESWSVSSVIGVAPEGQLRRAFLHYIERERARPYSPFSYYISWFDIAAPDRKMNAQQCLGVIDAFGGEMVTKRGVKLSAFVFDDGWDDNKTLWKFHEGFPDGFVPLHKAAGKYGARLGTWISPFGGYGLAKKERLQFGATQGFETNRVGFSLAGPNYYDRFFGVCSEIVRKQGISYLKFDGIGAGTNANGPGPDFGADLEALLHLIQDLRKVRADLFFNTTVGTWPSPFWLRWTDSIWRGGGDIDYLGTGTMRQKWMTYRDSLAFKIHRQRGPLYPLNSVKSQGVMFAKLSLAEKLSNDPQDVIADMRMAAASGTQMQEFFVTSSMMTPPLWDALAEAVAFSQRNANVLVDTHAIGGDPAKGEAYGYAAWTRHGGVLTLRNPTDRAVRIEVDVRSAFELPADAATRYKLRVPWKDCSDWPVLKLEAGKPHRFELAPYEVQVWEAKPL